MTTPKRPPLTVAEALRNIAAEALERRKNEQAALTRAADSQQPQDPDVPGGAATEDH